MINKRYLHVPQSVFKPSRSLLLLAVIGMLLLPPWISTGQGKVSKAKRTAKKQTTSTKALKINDVSYHIEAEKELFTVTLNRVFKPKVRYIKGATIHVVIVFSPVVDFEEKDYSKVTEGSKYIKQLRSYYESDKKELRFVLDANGTSDDYSIIPVSGDSGNIFTMEIKKGKSVKSEAVEDEDSLPAP
jgi:hypothetical protein